MDRKVVGVVFFLSGCNGCSGHLTPQLLDVVWCSAVVVSSCSVVEFVVVV